MKLCSAFFFGDFHVVHTELTGNTMSVKVSVQNAVRSQQIRDEI